MGIDLQNISERIYKIRENLKFLEEYKERCHEAMQSKIIGDALLYNLYLLSDRVLRLAEVVCRYKNAGYPDSYSGFIYRLGDIGVLEKEFAYKFAAIAKFRNFLAPQYEEVDKIRVCEAMKENLDDVKIFLEQIEHKIGV
ncbi:MULTISPECIES: DUF86 domain-containing protein [unclassified Nitratiruptor]|uniref:type VII toxin-antitoxin system HepT family RNase toxin n=1 Tax=unclassified Nitratiruptor TaxID=2624044 RepID=UPI0019159EB0|nr:MULTISPECIES: DUF86 domain-containing protein [unclassified Nitratiruptor]BCD60670.1 hypothetical protein NitYY0810_C1446 [Nitratiruptor sp. YY08-10]BCD64601.1 hypothetical protein NitYY0814_C1453 [Nitratiruptor sp. YY08-14]